MILSAILFTVSGVGCAISASFDQLVLYRIMGGVGIGVVSIISPLYISEVSVSKYRGQLVSLYQLAVTVGFLGAYLVNYWLLQYSLNGAANLGNATLLKIFHTEAWRGMLGMESLPAFIFFIIIFFIPESPRWLILKKKESIAQHILLRIYGNDNDVNFELNATRQAAQSETKSEWKFILKPGIFKAVLIGVAIAILGQFMTDKEMLKAPVMGITNVVGTRVAGVTMLQTSGQPGSDAASLLVRGQSATYIVDGIQRSFNEIDPNEIESVSVLKDATSAAVYGLDASAVVIVTTKKGKAEKMRISYNGSYGISQNANQIDWLDAPGYAYWYNQARIMDGDEAVFTSTQVQKMKDGVDGWGNTNWYKKVFDVGTNMHHNVSATGGNDKIHFFTSIGSFTQKRNVDKYHYDRLNLRSNIDAKLNNNLTFELGISGRVEMRDRPRYSADPNDWHNIPQQAVRALPYVPEKMTYQGKEYYTATPTASSPVSPIASINESGYYRSNNSYIQTNFSLKYDAPWCNNES